jgi:mannose-6-phosphate isomerase-like protein (cupin superfamily)
MTETTYLKRHDAMHTGPLPNCHDGEGALDYTVVLDGSDAPGRHLKFMHDDVLAPGVTIGLHTHVDDEEYYYILEGRGVMTLDGERFEVQTGDITAVYPGGEHGLENTSDADLRMIVVCTS